MNKTVKSLYTIIIIIMILLAGCGSRSPAGTPANTVTGTPPALTLTVMFPSRPVAYTAPNPLISTNTNSMNITVTSTDGMTTWGTGSIVAPPAGGIASTTVSLTQNIYYPAPTFPVIVKIEGVNASGSYTGRVAQSLTVGVGSTSVISIPFVEYDQGVANMTGISVVSPDGQVYTINDVFLSYYYKPASFTNGFTPATYAYEMGVKAIDASGAAQYHYSTQNTIYAPTVNYVSFFYNASATIGMAVPASGSSTWWNQYDISLNFAPGGVPGNTPTITGTFIGTFTYDIASATVLPASGTAGTNFTLTNASWANNVAPPLPNLPVVVF